MKINAYLIQFALLIIIIFGGTFMIRYVKTGELLVDQLFGFAVGILVLFFTVIFRKKQTIRSK